ncbi:MAG: hypothetical protein WC916_06295 [Candidatus Woesearchaeota archaeon]
MKQPPIKTVLPYGKQCKQITQEYHKKLAVLETKMREELGNDQLEFFRCYRHYDVSRRPFWAASLLFFNSS